MYQYSRSVARRKKEKRKTNPLPIAIDELDPVLVVRVELPELDARIFHPVSHRIMKNLLVVCL